MPAQAEKVFKNEIKHVSSVYFFQWIENILFSSKNRIRHKKNMLVNGVINININLMIFDLQCTLFHLKYFYKQI